jgi:hypothetical protein
MINAMFMKNPSIILSALLSFFLFPAIPAAKGNNHSPADEVNLTGPSGKVLYPITYTASREIAEDMDEKPSLEIAEDMDEKPSRETGEDMGEKPGADAEDNQDEEKEKKPSYWTSVGQATLGFSQISLSNWAAGGHESQSFNSRFNYRLNYRTPGNRTTWENIVDLRYGLINQKDRQTIKSDDLIDLSSKFGIRASENWAYSSLVSFRTQFAPGYRRPADTVKISDFMAPAYLNISVGMDHKFDNNIQFYLSPLAGRITYVLDEDLSNAGAFGVEPGEHKRYEFGGLLRALFRAELIENITAQSKLELFSNYLEKPQNMTVDFDTRINMRINQYISANLDIHMRYDENAIIRIDTTGDGNFDTTLPPRVQVKQVFGLQLSYSF